MASAPRKPRHITVNWITAVGHGWTLSQLLQNYSYRTSFYTEYNALAEYGWHTYEESTSRDVGGELREIAAQLRECGVTISDQPDDYVEHKALHSNDYNITYPAVRGAEPKTVRQEASHAIYETNVDKTNGVIFAKRMQSPRYRIDKGREQVAMHKGEHWNPDVPPLNQWSDVAFLQWKKTVGFQLHGLNVVFHHIIDNDITDRILTHIIGHNWNGQPVVVTPRGDDEETFLAILGTPHGKSTCYLLEQHSQDLGRKAVTKIVILQSRALRRDGTNLYHLAMVLGDLGDNYLS
ncbi:hypothetical protein JX265_009374 [Neoarthrinium moseri]|uniref:Uncharacterized protein n=1 Tax=Neoarthrinium moseri TaxID=1658444 RepID=A0A9P9WGF5_9PEZI|nr:hypothetical protein JX265_009374 [Neoarthrinium moseri]